MDVSSLPSTLSTLPRELLSECILARLDIKYLVECEKVSREFRGVSKEILEARLNKLKKDFFPRLNTEDIKPFLKKYAYQDLVSNINTRREALIDRGKEIFSTTGELAPPPCFEWSDMTLVPNIPNPDLIYYALGNNCIQLEDLAPNRFNEFFIQGLEENLFQLSDFDNPSNNVVAATMSENGLTAYRKGLITAETTNRLHDYYVRILRLIFNNEKGLRALSTNIVSLKTYFIDGPLDVWDSVAISDRDCALIEDLPD